jgi:hypothetical protein
MRAGSWSAREEHEAELVVPLMPMMKAKKIRGDTKRVRFRTYDAKASLQYLGEDCSYKSMQGFICEV